MHAFVMCIGDLACAGQLLAKQGIDLEEHIAQMAYEKQLLERYGLDRPVYHTAPAAADPVTEDEDER